MWGRSKLLVLILLIPSLGHAFLSVKTGGYWGRGELPNSSALGAEYGQAINGVVLSASSFYINQTIPKGSIPSGSVTIVPTLLSAYSLISYKDYSFGLGGGLGWGFTSYELGKEQAYLNNSVETVKTDIDDGLIFHFKFGLYKEYPKVSVGLDFNYLFFNPKFTTTRINSTSHRRYIQNDYLDFGGLMGGLTARFK